MSPEEARLLEQMALEMHAEEQMQQDMAGDSSPAMQVDEVVAPEIILREVCSSTIGEYITKVAEMTIALEEKNELTTEMARALVRLDPNTDNAEEGRALIKRMYKVSGGSPPETKAVMPATPKPCIEIVAGKVIQIETLQQDIDDVNHFNDFFANMYCQAYTNSLMTRKDGLSRVTPGGLDDEIAEAVKQVFGVNPEANFDLTEVSAIEMFIDAVELGDYEMDYSTLINAGEPFAEALALCPKSVEDEIDVARIDREDFFNDFNFLKYLKSL